MPAVPELSLHPNPAPANQLGRSFMMNMYSLHGKEVTILSGLDTTRTGIVEGFCFRSAIVRLHERPTETIIVPTELLAIVSPNLEEESDHTSTMSPASTSGTGKSRNATTTRHDAHDFSPRYGQSSGDTVSQFGHFQPDSSFDFTGWSAYEIILVSQSFEENVTHTKQAIALLVQGQIQRYGQNDHRAYALGEVLAWIDSDGFHRLEFSLPEAHDQWIPEALRSLPLVETVVRW